MKSESRRESGRPCHFQDGVVARRSGFSVLRKYEAQNEAWPASSDSQTTFASVTEFRHLGIIFRLWQQISAAYVPKLLVGCPVLDPGTLALNGTFRWLRGVGLVAYVLCSQGIVSFYVGLVSWGCGNMRTEMKCNAAPLVRIAIQTFGGGGVDVGSPTPVFRKTSTRPRPKNPDQCRASRSRLTSPSSVDSADLNI